MKTASTKFIILLREYTGTSKERSTNKNVFVLACAQSRELCELWYQHNN